MGKTLLGALAVGTLLITLGAAGCSSSGGADLEGNKWLLASYGDPDNPQAVIDLVLHEFGHHYESNHLSKEYYKALTKLGAQLTMLALKNPGLFKDLGVSF